MGQPAGARPPSGVRGRADAVQACDPDEGPARARRLRRLPHKRGFPFPPDSPIPCTFRVLSMRVSCLVPREKKWLVFIVCMPCM